jgi:hypothetical protein
MVSPRSSSRSSCAAATSFPILGMRRSPFAAFVRRNTRRQEGRKRRQSQFFSSSCLPRLRRGTGPSDRHSKAA